MCPQLELCSNVADPMSHTRMCICMWSQGNGAAGVQARTVQCKTCTFGAYMHACVQAALRRSEAPHRSSAKAVPKNEHLVCVQLWDCIELPVVKRGGGPGQDLADGVSTHEVDRTGVQPNLQCGLAESEARDSN